MKCKSCDLEARSIHIDEDECGCGITYCGNCDAEYSKEGQLLSGGIEE